MNALIINPGSSEIPIKIYLVTGLPDSPVIKQIDISGVEFPKTGSYEEIARAIAPALHKIISDVDFFLCRCPALNENVLGITKITDEFMDGFSDKIAIPHGSELGIWLGKQLSDMRNVPAIFSRGIPTSNLPEYASLTGHPEIRNTTMSHWEAVEGVAKHIASTTGQNFSDVAFMLVMIGSGIGIYAWENESIITYNVRQWNGPMSQSSIGTIDTLSLVDHFLGKGVKNLVDFQREVKDLTGKKGGLQLYNKDWNDLQNFQRDVRNGDESACNLTQAMLHQIVTKIGEARFAMSMPVSPIPIYFSGGGAHWTDFIESIAGSLPTPLFSNLEEVKMIDYDPEMLFFISQAVEYAQTLS